MQAPRGRGCGRAIVRARAVSPAPWSNVFPTAILLLQVVEVGRQGKQAQVGEIVCRRPSAFAVERDLNPSLSVYVCM